MNPDDIIPPQLQERLTYLGTMGDDAAWEIGDLAEELVAEHQAVRPLEVYRAVGLYTNRPVGTIRSYHYLSARVPVRLRTVYPQIGRSHLKLLADAAKGDEHTLEALMDTWIAERGYGSVDSMALWLRDSGNGVMLWEKRLRRMIGLAEKMVDDEHAPEDVVESTANWLSAVEGYR